MLNNSLLDVLHSSWQRWTIPGVTVKPIAKNEYLIITNKVNSLNQGICFYMIMNEDGTYTLNDKVLTVNSVVTNIGNFNAIKHETAALAAQYGILLDNQGEFVNQGIGQIGLATALNNFSELLNSVVEYAGIKLK